MAAANEIELKMTPTRPEQRIPTSGESQKSAIAPSVQWFTPGAFLARRIWARREVRLVTERFDGEKYDVTILLHRDPEELLDVIYTAELELHADKHAPPFTLRVTQPGSEIEGHASRLKIGRMVRFDSAMFKVG